MSGRNPPSYCTLTLIAMQGHQQKGRQNNTSSNNKDKYNTIIIETRTAEDHDDENLHNPETVQDAVIHLEVDEEQEAITQGGKRQAERTGFLAPYYLLLWLLFITSIQRIGCQYEKPTLHGGQSRSLFIEQGKENKR